MKVDISSYETETKYDFLKIAFDEITANINLFINTKDYGDSIEQFVMSCITIYLEPGYEKWHLPRRPKYIEHEIIKTPYNIESIEINKYFIYEVRLSNEQLDELSEADSEQVLPKLARMILELLLKLEKLPKKVRNFNKESFVNDIKQLFREKGFIEL